MADSELTRPDPVEKPQLESPELESPEPTRDEDAEAPPANPSNSRAPGRAPRRTGPDYWFNRLQTPVTLITATTALVLSILTWRELHATPEVSVTLPTRMRIAQQPDQIWLYLQPSFVTTQASDVPAVLNSARLELSPPSGDPMVLRWEENGTFVYDASTNRANYRYVGDPTPLVVTAQSPEMPTMLFSTEGRVMAGHWEGRLVVDQVQNGEVATDLCIEVTEDDMAAFDESDVSEAGLAGYFLFIRPAGEDGGCYEAKS